MDVQFIQNKLEIYPTKAKMMQIKTQFTMKLSAGINYTFHLCKSFIKIKITPSKAFFMDTLILST